MKLFMGHIVPYLHFIERENIFSSCVSSTQFFFFFKNLVYVFLFIPTPFIYPQNCFFQNLFCFSYFYRGRKVFFNLCGSQGELLLFIGGVVSIFYRVELFCVPLILYFLLSFIAYVYSLLSCLCQYLTKRGRSRGNVGILFVLFRGRYIDCL